MTSRPRSPMARWWAGRFHPLARYGYDMARHGIDTGEEARMWTGLAMVFAGLTIQRRRRKLVRRRPVYHANLGYNEAMEIRVLQSGEAVSEIEIPVGES